MSTLNDIIEEARDLLYTGQAQEMNRLQGAMGVNDTVISLRYPVGSAALRGTRIAVDLEIIRVWETSGSTITVAERGVGGSIPAAHIDGEMVEVQPKFPKFRVAQVINEDLDDLSSPMNGLFKVPMGELDITYNPALAGYDMAGVSAADVIAIQEVRYKQAGPTHYWPRITQFSISRDMSTSEFPSSLALFIFEGAYPGLPMHVRYRQKFSHLVNLTDDIQTVAGLPAIANGLPALGAAIALMAGREIKRNFTEASPDPLQLDLVVPGSVLKSYQGLMMQRKDKILAVGASLLQQYGSPAKGV